MDHISREVKEYASLHPFNIINVEATQKIREDKRYADLWTWGKEQGAYLDKIDYPCKFGPNGELLGVGLKEDVHEGDILMSVPCSMRQDLKKILSSELGTHIKALGITDD